MKYYSSTTQFNSGIDLHGRQMYVCLMDQEGKKLVHADIGVGLSRRSFGEGGCLGLGGVPVSEVRIWKRKTSSA